MTQKKKRSSTLKKVFLIMLLFILAATAITAWYLYRHILSQNVNLQADAEIFVNIPTGSHFDDVVDVFRKQGLLKDEDSFRQVAEWMNYTEQVKAGRFKIEPRMSNRDVIRLLRSGKQVPVDMVLRSLDTKQKLAGFFGKKLEADSIELLRMMNDKEEMKKYGFTTEQAVVMFIPDTYKFNWNTSAKGVMERMARQYKAFWKAERQKKAAELKLSQVEVSILASIVEKETSKIDEMPVVAGVYINRLDKGMKLDADPTLLFALNDPSIRRVLSEHTEMDSPYNTYRVKGLPPGPICLPSQQAIDAVLNRAKHKYIYFCAKEDFSGYHNFAVTLEQHNANARKYQRELNRQRVYR